MNHITQQIPYQRILLLNMKDDRSFYVEKKTSKRHLCFDEEIMAKSSSKAKAKANRQNGYYKNFKIDF